MNHRKRRHAKEEEGGLGKKEGAISNMRREDSKNAEHTRVRKDKCR